MSTKKISIILTGHRWPYEELTESLKDALISFDFDAEYIYGNKIEDFNIFITGKGAPNVDPGFINIFFETDHIYATGRQKSPIDYKKFTRSLHWFDYTPKSRLPVPNDKDLTIENIYYCPIGYSKYFDTVIPKEDLRPTFHMGRSGTYGYRDAFRLKYSLWNPGKNVLGDERDKLIVTSKVNINSRCQALYHFTPLHAALILSKGKLYMQEDFGWDDYNWYKPYLVLFTEENFREKLNYWINHDKERHEFERFIYEDIKKNHPFEKYLYAAIGDLLEQYR